MKVDKKILLKVLLLALDWVLKALTQLETT